MLIGGFLLALAVPMGGVVLGRAATLPAENRHPAPPPHQITAGFSKEFDAYYADRIGGRRPLLRLRNRVLLDAFHESPAANVVFGRDDWMFLNTGFDPMDAAGLQEPEVAEAAAALTARAKWCQDRGIIYIVQIAREKHMINPEHLPDRLQRLPYRDFIPELQAACPHVTILDPLPLLRAEALQQPVYYRHDSHWNTAGAMIGYLQLAGHLEKTVPGYRGKTRTDFTTENVWKSQGDLSMMAGLPTRMQGEWTLWQHQPHENVMDHPTLELEAITDATRLKYLQLQCRTSPAKNGIHILLLHDSFGGQFRDYIAGDVERFTAVGCYGFPHDVIEHVRPQIVVQQFVERIVHRNRRGFKDG